MGIKGDKRKMTEEKYGNSYGEKFRQYEDKIKELEKENAELKADNDARKFAMAMSEKVEKQLREENKKAKEIIKYLLSFIQKENYKTRWDINIAEAEQFISEVEK